MTVHADPLNQTHALAASLDPNSVSPGLLGFIIVVIIGVITWFLSRSMAKHLRKLDANRPPEEQEAGTAEMDAAPKNGKNPEPNGAH